MYRSIRYIPLRNQIYTMMTGETHSPTPEKCVASYGCMRIFPPRPETGCHVLCKYLATVEPAVTHNLAWLS